MVDGSWVGKMIGRKETRKKPLTDEVLTAAPPENEDLILQTDDYIDRLKRGEFDFVDLGTCDGGGFTIAARQGGCKGLGFDLEPAFVRKSIAKGLDVALYDVCKIEIDSSCADFAVCSHILEHLPSLQHVEKVLFSLAKLCKDYLLISGPVFESEDYLLSFGIKALHSLMLDHTCKMTVAQFQAILHSLELRDYTIALTGEIENSSNVWLHNAEQPMPSSGLWTYDEQQHLPKKVVKFDRRIYRDFVCVIPLRSGVATDEILERFYWGFDKVVVRSTWMY